MGEITHRQFRILADHMEVYQFMQQVYERDWRNGVPAPFFEYALSSEWMNKSLIHRNRIWLDDGKIVALCFYENPVTDVYFSLRPGYEFLAGEMVSYAMSSMPGAGGEQRLVIFGGQQSVMEEAGKAGWIQKFSYNERIFDFAKELNYPLPEGFRFAQSPLDPAKCTECCWKGFDHEKEEGTWNGDYESALRLMAAPHATFEHAVAIENKAGEYVCYAGMWWTPENRLAYMEPLCTVPAYRGRGLASAVLSECYRRMKAQGATHMTGGGDPFYEKIGFEPGIEWTFWRRG